VAAQGQRQRAAHQPQADDADARVLQVTHGKKELSADFARLSSAAISQIIQKCFAVVYINQLASISVQISVYQRPILQLPWIANVLQ